MNIENLYRKTQYISDLIEEYKNIGNFLCYIDRAKNQSGMSVDIISCPTLSISCSGYSDRPYTHTTSVEVKDGNFVNDITKYLTARKREIEDYLQKINVKEV